MSNDPEMTAYRVGPVDEQIPLGEGRAFAVGGEQVAVFRLRGGGLRAVSAVCPHAGGPIADGQIDAEIVVCPLHLQRLRPRHRLLAHRPGLRCAVYPVRIDDGDWSSACPPRHDCPPAERAPR